MEGSIPNDERNVWHVYNIITVDSWFYLWILQVVTQLQQKQKCAEKISPIMQISVTESVRQTKEDVGK